MELREAHREKVARNEVRVSPLWAQPCHWLFTAVVGLALVVWVHFVPTGDYEAPIEDIYAVYGSPLAGLLALVVLTGLVCSLVTLAITAIRALRSAKRP